MLSTAFFLVLAGFYLQYNLSKKVNWGAKASYLIFLEQRVLLSRLAGAIAAGLALFILLNRFGWGSGSFAFFLVGMCAAGLVVVLAPLRSIHIQPQQLLILYLGCLLLEYFVF